jgi:Flp pilus assembly protein TadG
MLGSHLPPKSAAHRPSQHGAAMLEFALIAPLLMVLVVGAIQFALWYHAQSVVLAAAQDGARLAAAESGTASAGQQRAQALLRAGVGRMATKSAVTAQRGPDVTVVEVSAELRPLLPLIGGLRLHASGRSVTERFRPTQVGGVP